MFRTRVLLTAVSLATASALALSGCAKDSNSTSGSSSSAKGDIVVGSVNSLSGIVSFPEASAAAKAVFAQVNAAGGIDGRKIKYVVQDDKVDPSTAAQAARSLVSSDGAVALVGGASLIECEINKAYYAQQKIMSVPGIGVDRGCFTSANISPVNPGPFTDSELSLTYGSEKLGLKKICGFVASAGSAKQGYLDAISSWTKATGKKLAYLDTTVANGAADFTPQVVKAKAKGCDGIFVNMTQADDLGFLKAAKAQGMSNVTWLFLTSAYSDQVAKAAGTSAGKGVYIPAEFYPYTNTSDATNAAWEKLMKRNNIALTSFAQGGYVAAENFVKVLKTINGPITRASVTKALTSMTTSIDNPMVGTPWIFGSGTAHNSARAGWEVTLKNGTWTNAATTWTVLAK